MQITEKVDDAFDEPHEMADDPPERAEQVDVPKEDENEGKDGSIKGSVASKSSHDDGKTGRSGAFGSFVGFEGVDALVSLS